MVPKVEKGGRGGARSKAHYKEKAGNFTLNQGATNQYWL